MSERTKDDADDVVEIEVEIELSEAEVEVEELSARLMRSLEGTADSEAADQSLNRNNMRRGS